MNDGHALRRLDAVFGGVVWWAMHLAALYWLVPRVCEAAVRWPLHVVTVVLVALCIRAGVSSVQLIRAGGAAAFTSTGRAVSAGTDRYLGWLGLLLSVFFGAVIVMQWLPVTILDACA